MFSILLRVNSYLFEDKLMCNDRIQRFLFIYLLLHLFIIIYLFIYLFIYCHSISVKNLFFVVF